MTDSNYVTVQCTVYHPHEISVWITLDGGKRSENLPLSSLHPDDLTAIYAADRVHNRSLRIRADMAKAKGLDNTHNPAAACGDLFGGK
jgi:hypothetical protein